ncbi:MAG: hypothetical protein ACK2UK_11970 [Candidatus Promineifilaceae bacterium]
MLTLDRRTTAVILAAILFLAATLRFFRLETMPPGLYHDEAYNGLDALSLLQGKLFPQFYEGWELYAGDAHAERPPVPTTAPIFFEGNYGREPLHVYLMALAIQWLGPTPGAVRAVPAAAGVLAVLTTFLAAQALLTGEGGLSSATTVALIAAFFLAILYPAVHFSRFGIRAMVFVPAETMAVACFWWAVNCYQRRGANNAAVWLLFSAAGFFLGLGIYTFAASRLLPLVWLLFIPLWFWRDRAALRALWGHVLVMGGAALLTALPLLIFFARYPYYFVFRIAYVANKGKGAIEGRPALTWLANVGRVGRGLLWWGETHLRHNLPGRPYLDPIQAFFFLVGLWQTLRRALRPRHLFLLIWLVVMLLPSILSGDAPHFGRLAGAAAPLAIFAALGFAWLWRLLRERFSGAWARAASVGLLALLLLSAAKTARDYFVVYANHPDLATDFYLSDWQLGRYASELDPHARLFLSPVQEELATIYFALGDPDRLQNYNATPDLLPAGTPGRATIYLLRQGQEEALDALRAAFPDAELEKTAEGVQVLHVPAEAPRPAALAAAQHSFGGAVTLTGYTLDLQGNTLLVTLFWRSEEEMDRDYTAYLHLLDGGDEIIAQIDRQPAGYPTGDWQPGEIVIARYEMPWPVGLDAGSVSLRTGFYYLPTLEPLGEAATLAAPGELAK